MLKYIIIYIAFIVRSSILINFSTIIYGGGVEGKLFLPQGHTNLIFRVTEFFSKKSGEGMENKNNVFLEDFFFHHSFFSGKCQGAQKK